ncbi:MAG: 50S ribosomal protein L24 [Candidatus Helarchaeota archaeon]
MKTKSPRKNRKRMFLAPNHRRNKYFNAKLIDELVEEYGIRRLGIRKGDHVMVFRGEFEGSEGKVTRVDRKNYRIYVEGIQIEKIGGASFDYPIKPSDVIITKLNPKKDKYRKKIIERKQKVELE